MNSEEDRKMEVVGVSSVPSPFLPPEQSRQKRFRVQSTQTQKSPQLLIHMLANPVHRERMKNEAEVRAAVEKSQNTISEVSVSSSREKRASLLELLDRVSKVCEWNSRPY